MKKHEQMYLLYSSQLKRHFRFNLWTWEWCVVFFAEPKNRNGTAALEPWNGGTLEPAVGVQSWVYDR